MPSAKVTVLSVFLAVASTVAAHGYVQGIVIGDAFYSGYIVTQYPYMEDPPAVIGWATTATNLGFIDGTEYADPDIICHQNATPAQLSAPVAAGGTVELQWTPWPDSHYGPVITYLANCNGNCSTVDKTQLNFVKIDQAGLINDTQVPGTWAANELIAANNSWTVTIPSSIEPGNYVLRHEIIALHSAQEVDGAQNYPQCINLEITGSGTASPSGTPGEDLYSPTDPGILINIYTSLSTYIIPGPTLWSGASSDVVAPASATPSASTTTAAAAAAAASESVSTSVVTALTTLASTTTFFTTVTGGSQPTSPCGI
ncbi:Endoglucanase-4 [Talaromyces atroroseus]|uniref:Endoglucanase-4 n=1 Tax=Talaromyces atroroseus TaxID=1441469 RepID=A0A225AS02_TALAT|nr:Endoglucanase-4 [Talaromyces atroroseus]OKL64371.1 Endoglucanase-4 [Talaromyces atroroseus]